jgi:hypothetical protein
MGIGMTSLVSEVVLGPSGHGNLRARNQSRDKRIAAFIVQLVALATGVSPREIAAADRHCAEAARARQIAIYLAHTACAWPLARVAQAFGRDRTTCSYAVKRVEELRDNAVFDGGLMRLESCIRVAPVEGAQGARR